MSLRAMYAWTTPSARSALNSICHSPCGAASRGSAAGSFACSVGAIAISAIAPSPRDETAQIDDRRDRALRRRPGGHGVDGEPRHRVELVPGRSDANPDPAALRHPRLQEARCFAARKNSPAQAPVAPGQIDLRVAAAGEAVASRHHDFERACHAPFQRRDRARQDRAAVVRPDRRAVAESDDRLLRLLLLQPRM